MALRQTTGFVESLLQLVGLDWTVPDFSTLSPPPEDPGCEHTVSRVQGAAAPADRQHWDQGLACWRFRGRQLKLSWLVPRTL